VRSDRLRISETPHDTLQQLARFRHDETQTIQVHQYFEELRSFERFDGISKIATLTKGNHEVGPSLGATGGDTIWR
jgi:hypothetical protein